MQKPMALVAAIPDDMVLGYIKDYADSLKHNYAWHMTPSYKRYDSDGYDGRSYGASFGVGANLDGDNFTFSVDTSKSKTNYEYSSIKSDNLNLGFNYIGDFGAFKLLGGLNAGISKKQSAKIRISEFTGFKGKLR